MTSTASTLDAARAASPVAPPFKPDPEIIGNYEGNKRVEKHDKRAAERFLAQTARR